MVVRWQRVLVSVVLERVQASGKPMMADSNIAEVRGLVGRRRGLVEHRRGLEPHTHTDMGHSNIVADSSTGTDGNNMEEDKPGQLPLQCQWEGRCRFGFLLQPGPKILIMR